MKKIFLFLIALSVILINNPVYAQEALDLEQDFKMQVADIVYYKDIKKTQFNVNMNNIPNPQNIGYWKIRTSCDKRMVLQLSTSSANDCNKVIRIDSLSNNMISFLFKNKTPNTKDFSIKVKAYTRHGKGLFSDQIGFGWK